jgi:hypothetical protein
MTPDSDGTLWFSTNTLSAGTHRVLLTVKDEMGETCSDSIYRFDPGPDSPLSVQMTEPS